MIKDSTEENFLVFNPDTIWNEKYNKYILEMTNFYFKKKINNILLVVHKDLSFDKRLQGDFNLVNEKLTKDNNKKFIVATEPHILHQMKKNEPNKTFLVAPGNDGSCSCSNCPYMELNTLEKLRDCLLHLSPEIKISKKQRS